MKMDLISMVQDIQNDLDLDEVNSIDDTQEAMQIAQILKTTYFAMMSNRNWPHLRKSISLNPTNSAGRPTHMTVPANIKELDFINYNTAKIGETRSRYKEIKWLEPDAFLRRSNILNSDEKTVEEVKDLTGVTVLIQNNKQPEFFTSFDDDNVIFDSYDNSVDSTLQASKVQAMAYVMPEWNMSDTFIPDLPAEAFIALLEEAKSKAAYRLKQQADEKAEQESQRQQRWLSRKAWQVKGGIKYPDYGRGRSRNARDVTFSANRNY